MTARAAARAWCLGAAGLLVAAAPALAQPAGPATAASAASAPAPAPVSAVQGPAADVQEPRAYGYFVGDVVARRIQLQVPAGLALDTASLPRPGKRGGALELRSVAWRQAAQALVVEYQVLLSPPTPRVLEMPAFELRFTGAGGQPAGSLRIEAWPVAVSPLVAAGDPPARRGYGEMQPDEPPPQRDLQPHAQRLLALAAVAALLGLYLLHVYVGLPWWARRYRPFGLAWHTLRGLPENADEAVRRQAWADVHAALNRTAGRALLDQDVPAFVAAQPRWRAVQAELHEFFARSRRSFFAGEPAGDDLVWLRGFCRRCRDVERGAA